MAYVIGIISLEEQAEMESRGWEFEDAPMELIPDDMEIDERPRMKSVWVDSSMFEIMNGPDWEGPK
jgi:hypothetical protein